MKFINKFKKLRRDPDGFFHDMFAKRVMGRTGLTRRGTISLDTTDFEIDDAVVVITNPNVVARLRELKQTEGKRVPISLIWWDR